MDEAERLGVQRLPGQDLEEIVIKRPPFSRVQAVSDDPPVVGRIAEDGMADVSGMNADLVRPARLQPKTHESREWHGLDRLVMGDGMFAFLGGDDGHLLPVAGVAPDGGVDGPCRRVGHAPHEAEVAPQDRALLELSSQRAVRHVVLGHDHQARGVFVETMYDAGAYNRITGTQRCGVDRREA